MRIRFSLAQLFLLALLCSQLALMFSAVLRSGKPRRPLSVHFSPKGKYLAVQFTDSTEIWRRTSGTFRKASTLKAHARWRTTWMGGGPRTPFVNDDVVYLLEDGALKTTIVLVDAGTGRRIKEFSVPANVSEVSLSSDASTVIVQRFNSKLEIWDWGANQPRLSGVTGDSFAISPDQKRIVTSNGGAVALFDAVSGSWIGSVSDHMGALTYSPDGRYFAGPSRQGAEYQVWSAEDLTVVERINLPNGAVEARFSLDGKKLMLLEPFGETLFVKSIGDGRAAKRQVLKQWPAARSVSVDPDGRTIAIAANKGVYVGNVAGTRKQTVWSRYPIQAAAKHAAGLYLWAVVWGLWSRREQSRRSATSGFGTAPDGLRLIWLISAIGGAVALFLSAYLFFRTGLLIIPTFYLGIILGILAALKAWGCSFRGLTTLSVLQVLNVLNLDIINLGMGVINFVVLRDPLVTAHLKYANSPSARDDLDNLDVWTEEATSTPASQLPANAWTKTD